ncbi:Arc family DNA-binding protein [Aestuariimicrobium sp. p3-SID1156]|uniref:FitA-like ribbon-helix-helix domain-containing protein n=1 Tax=Aestuariimicrobium sp. p3-SID1156 TaxID=2916038 RepID=UPI00223C3877|nr:Arc family DNA-binding protein [Aestuariimicrobium sp. p3-SID1156]MCT1458959.1 Arc family DNA-binding protein [Aestuariimicrobium sp. p3-SID1156]
MTAITIRQLPEGLKDKLRLRAAAKGHSMEAEARAILTEALERPAAVDLTWVNQVIEVGEQFQPVHLAIPDSGPATSAEL